MKNLLLIFFFALFFIGCSSVRLKTQLFPSKYDYPMYGRTPERNFFDSSLFTFPLELAWEYDASAGFSQSPMSIIGNTLLIGTLQGELHAVHIETGKRIGELKTFAPVQAAPTMFKNLLIIGLESGKENLIAYKVETGEDRWIRDVGGVVASPLVWNDQLIVGGLNGKLVCFDQYGIETWSFDTEAEIRASPALAYGIAFCASTKGEVFAINATDGKMIWKATTKNAIYAGLTIADSILIAASRDSSVYFFDVKNGNLKNKIFTGNKIVASPSTSHGVVYISSLSGTVSAYRIETGDSLWSFKANSAINTTPFVTPSAIFVASLDKSLYALDPESGNLLWKKEFENRIKTNPIVCKNMLLVACEDKMIYCLRSTFLGK